MGTLVYSADVTWSFFLSFFFFYFLFILFFFLGGGSFCRQVRGQVVRATRLNV